MRAQPAKPVRKAVLVYQGGIANVFKVDCFNMAPYGRRAIRLLQGDFASCLNYARGMAKAGCVIRTASCNRAGDIADMTWIEGVSDCPFRDSPHCIDWREGNTSR